MCIACNAQTLISPCPPRYCDLPAGKSHADVMVDDSVECHQALKPK